MSRFLLSHLSHESLLAHTLRLVARERETTAELLAHLAEVDDRQLYRQAAYPSMFAWCMGHLGFSEDMAGRRIKAARLARRFPVIFDCIADGRLHLTAVNLLEQHLTEANAAELIAAASHRSRAEIEQMLADRSPKADVPTVLRAIPTSCSPEVPHSPAPAQVNVAADALQPCAHSPAPAQVNVAADALQPCAHSPAPAQVNVAAAPDPAARTTPAASPVSPASPTSPASSPAANSRVSPLGDQRFALQATISQATHDSLRRAQELLGPAARPNDLDAILSRALALLVKQLESRKCGRAAQPRAPRAAGASNARHIPADVRRRVWARDGGRCTFVSDTGRRCECRRGLEFDHILPVARGGESTVANLRLRCRAHNQLEAEREFGAGFMADRRASARGPQPRASVAAPAPSLDATSAPS